MTHAKVHRSCHVMRLLAAVLILMTPVAWAQAQSAASLSGAAANVDVEEKVRVLRLDGTEIRGELSAIEPTFIDIDVDSRVVRIDAADIREIAVKDGVYNGILFGMGAGLAGGLVTGFLLTSPEDGNLRGIGISLAAAVGLGAGIGLGAAFDASKAHYRTIYGTSPTVRVSPLAAPGLYGAAVAVGW